MAKADALYAIAPYPMTTIFRKAVSAIKFMPFDSSLSKPIDQISPSMPYPERSLRMAATLWKFIGTRSVPATRTPYSLSNRPISRIRSNESKSPSAMKSSLVM